jgi:hypothetical protein
MPVSANLKPRQLRRNGYQSYHFGHLAFPYIEEEVKRKNAASKGSNGNTQ